MAKSPPEGYPRICTYLLYEDGAAAIDFLTRTFGFRERMRIPMEDGRVGHAELEFEDGLVMLGEPGGDYKSPKRLGARTQMQHIYVEDVDAVHERAKEAGAEIKSELADQPYGDRSFSAADPEGHEWHFSQHVRDVSPEEYGATTPETAAVS
jgi:PhnB protein